MRAVRTVQTSGRNEPELLAALTAAGGLGQSPWDLSPAGLQQLLAEALAEGNAKRGEDVFRRADLTCQKCHAIGGAGGQVGPDLASIGASAQADYILESILLPNAKIKENYHSLIVETDQGLVLTGIKVRETDTDLILRNAENEEILVPLDSIEERSDGGSLMPQSLLDSLTRDELLDLVRFLSELGKVGGEFSLPRKPVIHSWQVLESDADNANALRNGGLRQAATRPHEFRWRATYSRVSGELPIDDLPRIEVAPGRNVVVLRSSWDADETQTMTLRLNRDQQVTVWLDGERLENTSEVQWQQAAGRHELTLVVDAVDTDRAPVRGRDACGGAVTRENA